MTDKKLTDKEIIKALECCLCDNSECLQCQNKELCRIECDELATKTIDLITRQQAEIEGLKEKQEKCFYCIEQANKKISEIKSEAYKECLAKVKNYIKTHCNPYGKPDFDYDTSIKILNFINKLAKEMVGDDNA